MGALRTWLSSAGHGDLWWYARRRGEIEIAPLVSPLRFDVTVRQSFFAFLSAHRDLYADDFERFASEARRHDYFIWFRDIMCVAWQPHVLADGTSFDRAWEERLHATAALQASFDRRGFDTRFPVTLYEGRTVRPTAHGKRLARSTFAGDGNHRLALLMSAGRTSLEPSQYRIKRYWSLEPIDTTPQLLEALRIDEQRYRAFLRAGYPDSPDAAAQAELEEIFRIDSRHLSRGID